MVGMETLGRIEHIYRTCIYLFFSIGKQYRLESHIVEEIVQDAFAAAIISMDRIKINTEAGIRGYIIRIFRNKCIDHIKANINGSGPIFDDSITAIDIQEDPLHELLICEEMRLRDYAVSAISPKKYREPVRLYLEGHSPKNIAETLNKNRSTTRNLIQRGLKIFETLMLKLDPLRKDT